MRSLNRLPRRQPEKTKADRTSVFRLRRVQHLVNADLQSVGIRHTDKGAAISVLTVFHFIAANNPYYGIDHLFGPDFQPGVVNAFQLQLSGAVKADPGFGEVVYLYMNIFQRGNAAFV